MATFVGKLTTTAGRVLLPAVLAGIFAGCGGQDPTSPAPTRTGPGDPFDEAAHAEEIESWRARRLEGLTSETGWLTVVGLHWLEAGENRFGTDPDGRIVLPEGTAPPTVGSFLLEGDRVSVLAGAESGLTLDGEPLTGRTELRPDDTGEPDVLRLGDLSLYVIKRDERHGIRVKDPNSPARRDFEGIDYFPISSGFRVEAEFVPYDRPKTIQVPTVLGTTTPMQAPGYVRFSLGGTDLTLEPVVDSPEDKHFFFILKDQTSGTETYPGGRFLYTDASRDGRVVLDFNKAYNPPCAFTAFATCPLPPRQNILAARIEAGEKTYGHHGAR